MRIQNSPGDPFPGTDVALTIWVRYDSVPREKAEQMTHARTGYLRTAANFAAVARSVASDPRQTAAALALLAGTALTSPLAALVSVAAGVALLTQHHAATRSKEIALGKNVDKTHAGIIVATDRRTGAPVTMDFDALRRNVAVEGGSEAERSGVLLGLAERNLAAGGGCIIFDATGDASIAGRVRDIVGAHGREDDLMIVDAQQKWRREALFAEDMNPFQSATVDEIVGMIAVQLPTGSYEAKRASALLRAVTPALVCLRPQGHALDAGALERRLSLGSLIELSDAAFHPAMPDEERNGVAEYLTSLPGYDPARGNRQASSLIERHNAVAESIGRVLRPLDIFLKGVVCNNGDIDVADVIDNRRVLVVMLPARTAISGSSSAEAFAKLLIARIAHYAAARTDGPPVRAAGPPVLVVIDGVGHYACSDLTQLARSTGRQANLAFALGSPAPGATMRSGDLSGSIAAAGTQIKIGADRPSNSFGWVPAIPMRRRGKSANLVEIVTSGERLEIIPFVPNVASAVKPYLPRGKPVTMVMAQ